MTPAQKAFVRALTRGSDEIEVFELDEGHFWFENADGDVKLMAPHPLLGRELIGMWRQYSSPPPHESIVEKVRGHIVREVLKS